MTSLPRGLAGLILLVLVAVGGWSLYWFIAHQNAREALAQALTDEAQNGRAWSCERYSSGGYPFRFEGLCEGVTLRFARQNGAVGIARFAQAEAVTQAWNPQHVILRLTGPLRVSDEAGAPLAEAAWESATASVQWSTEGVDTLSLALETASLNGKGQAEGTGVSLASLLLHARPSGPRGQDLDVLAKAQGLNPRLPLLPAKAYDVELQASSKAALRVPYQPVLRTLRDWQTNDGRLDLVLLKIAQADTAIALSGKMALTPLGFPQGNLDLSAAGIDRWLADLGLGNLPAPLVQGAMMMGRDVTLDGKPAKSFGLAFEEGRMRFGPFTRPVSPLF